LYLQWAARYGCEGFFYGTDWRETGLAYGRYNRAWRCHNGRIANRINWWIKKKGMGVAQQKSDKEHNLSCHTTEFEVENAKDDSPGIQYWPEEHRFAGSLSNSTDSMLFLQPKLKIGKPNDPYEQEADRIADLIVQQMGTNTFQPVQKPQISSLIQSKSQSGDSFGTVPSILAQTLQQGRGQGNSLTPTLQSEMEQGFGHDFSGVRIHTDAKAVQFNRQLGARAFTFGSDVYFNEGEFQPASSEGRRLLAHELTHVVQQRQTIQSASHLVPSLIQRDEGMMSIAPPVSNTAELMSVNQAANVHTNFTPVNLASYPDDQINSIVVSSLLSILHSFQNIPIEISGVGTDLVGGVVNKTKKVAVKSKYYINSEAGSANYQNKRQEANFNRIIGSLRNQKRISIIKSEEGRALTSGRAVELGKGTPEDIRLFVQEAVSNGTIENYGISKGKLLPGQLLVDLPLNDLSQLIENWMEYTGVGVDCSGFVLQAAKHARQALRSSISSFNSFHAIIGTDFQYEIPAEVRENIRNASSFTNGPEVTSPIYIKPGDAWVTPDRRHIRIVIEAYRATKPDGTPCFEIVSAESSGGGTQPLPGPVRRVWQTFSLETITPLTPVDAEGPLGRGTFHRIP
jgi:hypothetical protein